jgi:hypothetical protein
MSDYEYDDDFESLSSSEELCEEIQNYMSVTRWVDNGETTSSCEPATYDNKCSQEPFETKLLEKFNIEEVCIQDDIVFRKRANNSFYSGRTAMHSSNVYSTPKKQSNYKASPPIYNCTTIISL